jgi:hypothetical protein
MSSFELQILVGGSEGFYLMLTLPPPARNSPARVAKPMTLGPILRTIAAMHVLHWFDRGRFYAIAGQLRRES